MSTPSFRNALARPALVLALALPIAAAAQAQAHHRPAEVRYVITELGSLGGTESAGASINDRQVVAGYSRLPAGDLHAAVWRAGSVQDLGTLGGPNSAVLWPVKNDRGLVVGVSETADIDPRDEAWSCAAFFGADTEHACVGFVWEDGAMRPLPTFGGTHGFATGVNNRGQVVGWAETADEDPSCNQVDQFLGFQGALWDTRHRLRELPPLPGDTASAATAINDRGQVVGISGACSNAVGGLSARRAVVWEHGEPVDIGNLGADAWSTPMAINDRGVVVGFANKAGTEGSAFNEEAFVWTRRGGIRSLGTLAGNDRSQALGVNRWGQIVGLARGGQPGTRAFVWQDGVMTDLNGLAVDYDGHLVYANDINDAGAITGAAVSAETGELVAFVATPIRP